MTNLQAMQDEQLLELIRDLENLERLKGNLIPCNFPSGIVSEQAYESYEKDAKLHKNLSKEVAQLKLLVSQRWKELMEDHING